MQDFSIPMTSFERLPLHKKIAERAITKLTEDDRVIGLYLSGSFAEGKPDIFSDLDLFILVPDNQRRQPIEDHNSLINEIGKVGARFPAVHLGDPNQIIVFYEEDIPIHVDFQYKTPKELSPNAKGKKAIIVLDRSGELIEWQEMCHQSEADYSPSLDEVQYIEDRFWGWVWYTYSKIARGELWEARSSEEYLRNNVIVKLMYHNLFLPDEGNRRIEQKIPHAYIDLLEESIPKEHGRDAYLQSLMSLIDGYLRLIDDVVQTHMLQDLRRMDKDYFLNAIHL